MLQAGFSQLPLRGSRKNAVAGKLQAVVAYVGEVPLPLYVHFVYDRSPVFACLATLSVTSVFVLI